MAEIRNETIDLLDSTGEQSVVVLDPSLTSDVSFETPEVDEGVQSVVDVLNNSLSILGEFRCHV